jgi:hypothetical protein
MISARSVGRLLALGGLLGAFISFSAPVSAQKKKGGAAAQTDGSKKKKKSDKKSSKKADDADEKADTSADDEPAKPKPEAKAKKSKSKGKGKKKKKEVQHRVIVMPFDGPNGKKLHGYVVDTLPEVDGVSDVVDEEAERENSSDAATAIAKEQDGSAVVYGTASKKKGQLVLELTVRNGADGEVIREATFKGGSLPKLKNKVTDGLPEELGDAIPESKAPAATVAKPEPKPKPEEEAKPEAEEEEPPADKQAEPEEEPADTSPKKRLSPLEVGAGFRVFTRSLNYKDDLHDFDPAAKEQSTYSGPGAALFLNFRWYPVAHVTGGPASNIGLTGGFEKGFLTKAKPPSGPELDVSHQEFFLGLRGRIPLGAHHELGIAGTYGQHTFTIEGDEILLPDVKYSYLRPGVDGRFRFGRAVLGFSLGYRHVLSAGQIMEKPWYPNASAMGMDAGIFGGYAITKQLDLLVGLDLRRYGFSLKPEPAVPPEVNNHVAGGATDQYLGGWIGAGFRLPEKE